MKLGEFLNELEQKILAGTDLGEGCVLCGSTDALHPVGRAWACSECHGPEHWVVVNSNLPRRV